MSDTISQSTDTWADKLANALTSPGVSALLGMTQGFAQAAMPTRVPTPFMSALGMGLGGLQGGINSGTQVRQNQQGLLTSRMKNTALASELPLLLSKNATLANMWAHPELIQQMMNQGGTTLPPANSTGGSTTVPTPAADSTSMSSGGVPPAQRASLIAQANQGLAIPPSLHYGLIDYETGGGWSPTVKNPDSGAAGLPQALASTAARPGYGVPPIDISKASPLEQARWAGQYLQGRGTAAGVTNWTDPAQVTKALIAYHGPEKDANGIDGATYAQQVLARSQKYGQMVMRNGRQPFDTMASSQGTASTLGAGAPTSGTTTFSSNVINSAEALNKSQEYEQRARRADQIKQLGAMGFPVFTPDDPPTLRATGKAYLDLALAGPKAGSEAANKAAVELATAGGIQAAKSANENVTVRADTMARVMNPDGSYEWVKNPRLEKMQLDDGRFVWGHISPAMPGSPPGTSGRMDPVVDLHGTPISADISPYSHEFMVERGKGLADQFQKIDLDAASAKEGNYLFDNLRRDSQSWEMGKFADFEGDARAWLSATAHAFGIPAPELDKKLADYQAFIKSSGSLLRTAVHDVSSRAAVQEYNLIGQTLPQPTTSQQGFSQVADQWQGANDFRLAKQKFAEAYNGDPKHFNVDFNSQVSPISFMLNRMNQTPQGKEDAHDMFARMQATPEGRIAVRHMMQQYNFAKEHHLFEDLSPTAGTPAVAPGSRP